jgi:hypothetical protein
MEQCKAKRGFFSLRDCGEMSVRQCALCGRPVCSAHLSPASGFTRCLDCEGRAAEKQAVKPKEQPPVDQPLSDPGWSYRYRNRYYGTGYAPIYMGRYHDSYYDDYDLRSFDSSRASRGPSMATERDSGAGLGDS